MPEFQGIISNLKTNFVGELIEENFFRTHRKVFFIPGLQMQALRSTFSKVDQPIIEIFMVFIQVAFVGVLITD